MSVPIQDSVVELLADLHAERERTWEPANLQANIAQRRRLVDTADRSRFVKSGDLVESFSLEDVDGATLTLEALLAQGPAVLLFFRYAGCPACNVALPYYNRRLAAAVRGLGATLVGVSPQPPKGLVEIKRRHGLNFPIATDRDNRLGHRFGIVFEPDEVSKSAALAKGSFLGDVTGTGTWELPMPTIVVIGQDRRVQFAEVSPDWMVRTEAEPVLEALRDLALDRVA